MKPLIYSKIARARELAEAIANGPVENHPQGVREVAAEIVELLQIEDDLPTGPAVRLSMTRLSDDAQALRASIGGREEIGYYLTFRGDPAKVVEMLTLVCGAAEAMLPSGNYKDERGDGV